MNHSNDNGNSSSLRVKLAEHSESGLVEVPGALSKNVEDAQQLLQFFKEGSEFRTTASTKMNADSSRSHLITTITVSLTNKRTDHVISGKMTLGKKALLFTICLNDFQYCMFKCCIC